MLKADQIARELKEPTDPSDRLIIAPPPDLAELKRSGAASIDVRLGCWFLAYRPKRSILLDPSAGAPDEARLAKSYFVPFGQAFMLHPKSFILAATLEWFRLPSYLGAYVVGRSSWGRYGLIIATAIGVHPGFAGCLTLELSNVGEIPIAVRPGTPICQVFVHRVESGTPGLGHHNQFIGHRKPTLPELSLMRVENPFAEDGNGCRPDEPWPDGRQLPR